LTEDTEEGHTTSYSSSVCDGMECSVYNHLRAFVRLVRSASVAVIGQPLQ
jgi:hypothetical protein